MEPKDIFKKGLKLMTKDISFWKNAPLWNKTSIKHATKNGLSMLNKNKRDMQDISTRVWNNYYKSQQPGDSSKMNILVRFS